MISVDYRYELRHREEIVATGHLSREESLEVGDRLTVGSREGIVRDDRFVPERSQIIQADPFLRSIRCGSSMELLQIDLHLER
jgi:hypothetical protein